MIGKIITALIVVLALSLGIYAATCWEKVPAGNVGIKVYLLGSDKGVDNEQLGVGRQWIGWQQELYLYPTYTKNDSYTVQFNDVDGAAISGPVGVAYHVDPSKAAVLFQKYREDIDQISQAVIARYIQDAFVRHAGNLKVEDINGPLKGKLIADVTTDVQGQLSPMGLVIEKLNWLGNLTLPPNVQSALNNKITATQDALARENQVATAKAQADIERAKAQGEADAELERATADAKAIQMKSDALKANPELVAYTLAQKWNGEYPSTLYIGTDQGKTLFQVPSPKGQ
jgi:regulator of protease activity HflC (stomatin/prohibitin superfamily)